MGGGSSLPFEMTERRLWIGDEVCAQLQAQVAKQQAPRNSSAQEDQGGHSVSKAHRWRLAIEFEDTDGDKIQLKFEGGQITACVKFVDGRVVQSKVSFFEIDQHNRTYQLPVGRGSFKADEDLPRLAHLRDALFEKEVTGTDIVVEIRLLSGSLVTRMVLPCAALPTAGDVRRAFQGAPVMQHTRLVAGSVTLEDHQQLQSFADENGKVEICIVLDPEALHVLARQKYEREQDVKLEKYRAENTKAIEEFDAAIQTMLRDEKKAREEEFSTEASDPNEYAKLWNEIFEKFCSRVEEVTDVPKTKKPSVAFLGAHGVGKSALINALVGTPVTPEGVIATTAVASKVHESPTTEFWDVPGYSEVRSFFNLKRILAIKEMHLIIIVYLERPNTRDIKLAKFIRACKVPCICVRNKVDNVMIEDLDTEKVAFELEAAKLSAPLIFVSAKTGEGLDSLKSSAMKLPVGVSLDSSEDSSSEREKM